MKDRDVTPESVYLSRRNFLRGAALAGTVATSGLLYRAAVAPPPLERVQPRGDVGPVDPEAYPRTAEVVGESSTPFEKVAGYNNFYEFSTEKTLVAERAAQFVTRPWTITVDGLVAKPRTFDLDDVVRLAPIEERIYRFRCVEGWSMVIPWLGLPLAALLNAVEPLGSATHVAFTTLFDPERMPNQKEKVLDWPYVEGLRLDEARHPLTLLSTGLYGKSLPPQNGAPLRLVVPWKYGFKSIKSIVSIRLVDAQPPTTWSAFAPSEYGFYSNVNPDVDHPRWSQRTERRIGEYSQRDTLPFNGYADHVGSLYTGMDLRKNF